MLCVYQLAAVEEIKINIKKAVANLPVPVFIISGLFYRLSRI